MIKFNVAYLIWVFKVLFEKKLKEQARSKIIVEKMDILW